MSRLLVLAVVLGGCTPPPPPAPAAPEAPVLDLGPEPLVYRRAHRLTGVAPGGTVVRVFVDAACAGPVYLEVTAEGLAGGVEVELLDKAENVFSALAIGPTGLVSSCSAPVQVRLAQLTPPRAPTLMAFPFSSTSSAHFTIKGSAQENTRVRLHSLGMCSAPILAELSAADFEMTGFGVDVPSEGTHSFAADVVDAVNEVSACSAALLLTIDHTSPRWASLALGSPSPSTQTAAYVFIRGDFSRAFFMPTRGCTGPSGPSCDATFGTCRLQVIDFPAEATTTWSIWANDEAGNGACFDAPEWWVHDSSGPPEAVQLFVEPFGGQVRVRVPTDRAAVAFFESNDCSGAAVITTNQPWVVVENGVYDVLPTDGGPLTARAVRTDGGLDPCSNAVVAP